MPRDSGEWPCNPSVGCNQYITLKKSQEIFERHLHNDRVVPMTSPETLKGEGGPVINAYLLGRNWKLKLREVT